MGALAALTVSAMVPAAQAQRVSPIAGSQRQSAQLPTPVQPSSDLLVMRYSAAYYTQLARELAQCLKVARSPNDCTRLIELTTRWQPGWDQVGPVDAFVAGVDDPDGWITKAYLVMARAANAQPRTWIVAERLYRAADRIARVRTADAALALEARLALVAFLDADGGTAAAHRALSEGGEPSRDIPGMHAYRYWQAVLWLKLGQLREGRDALSRYLLLADTAERTTLRFGLALVLAGEDAMPDMPLAQPARVEAARTLIERGIESIRRSEGADALEQVRPLCLLALIAAELKRPGEAKASLEVAAGIVRRGLEAAARRNEVSQSELEERSRLPGYQSSIVFFDPLLALWKSPRALRRDYGEAYRNLALAMKRAGLAGEAMYALRFAENTLMVNQSQSSRMMLDVALTRAMVLDNPSGFNLGLDIAEAEPMVEDSDLLMIRARYLSAALQIDTEYAVKHMRRAAKGALDAQARASSAENAIEAQRVFQPVYRLAVRALWLGDRRETRSREFRAQLEARRVALEAAIVARCGKLPDFVPVLRGGTLESCIIGKGPVPPLAADGAKFTSAQFPSGRGEHGIIVFATDQSPQDIIRSHSHAAERAGLRKAFGNLRLFGAEDGGMRLLVVAFEFRQGKNMVTLSWGRRLR